MALNFPATPTLNQTYSFGAYTWQWDGNSWVGAVPIVNATINNTTIGAVTPSTGAFTTLSASSTVSGTGFSTYLASPPAIGSSAANTGAFTSLTSTSGAFNGTVGATTASTGAFTTLNSSGQTLLATSTGNVGIGTTSPATRLHVTGTGNGCLSLDTNSTFNTSISFYNAGVIRWTTQVLGDGTNAYRWYDFTANAERMRIDSAGNLGLGVTPSAWFSSFKGIDQPAAALFSQDTTNTILSTNSYLNTSASWIYKNTGAALAYIQGASGHSWYIAPSGTAGNAITFTQAMTLDASGRLLLGTTSDFGGATLQIAKANSTGLDGNIRVSNNVDTSMMLSTVATNVSGIYSSGAIAFGTGSNTFTERARIDSSGNLLVGTTTATGSISNTAPVVAGVFKTISGSVSVASGYTTTIATLGGYANKTFIVSCGIENTSDPNNYAPVSIVSQDGTVLRITSLQTAALLTISISGSSVQAMQASGAAQAIIFTLTRIS